MSATNLRSARGSGHPGRAILATDRDVLRLSSPRGDAVSGTINLTNRGDAPLEGVVAVRVGSGWLSGKPATLLLEAGETRAVAVQATPSTLPQGYTRGEIEIVSNGGSLSVPVTVGVRAGHSWRLLALTLVAAAAVTVVVGVALARVRIPPTPPTTPSTTGSSTATRHATTRPTRLRASGSFDRRAALTAIRSAILTSNDLWQSALTHPSTVALASVKTGRDLARATAEVQDLIGQGEHWTIASRRFDIVSRSLRVNADGSGASAEVVKTERRALYGPGHERIPYEVSDATYHLRYNLLRHGGRWLVDDVAVLGVTPLQPAPPLAQIEQVAARVLPVVMHVEADSATGTAVGTGFVIRSSSDGSDVITNDHVVTGASTVKLQRWTNGAYTPTTPWVASKVWEDGVDDLAVVRITQGNLPVATWGNSQALQPGQQVVAVGYAENLAGGPTVTTGIVSSVLRTAPGDASGQTYIGHSATINHGNSGGPLSDMSGEIVGINTWTLDGTQGLFFAIPSSRAARVAADVTGTNG